MELLPPPAVTARRAHSSRLYLLAPNLYATSRRAWDSWQALTSNEKRRYLGLARRSSSSDPDRAARIFGA